MSLGKGIAIAACVAGCVYLGTHDHVGLAGWLIFVAVCLA